LTFGKLGEPYEPSSCHTTASYMQAGVRTPKKSTMIDVYTRFYSCRQCWLSKCRGL
jgi:hypothetical protein